MRGDHIKLAFPRGARYSAEHVWLTRDHSIYRAGLTDFAQAQLGEIVYIDLPEIGDVYEKGDVFGSVESMQTISELFMPVDAEIIEVNSRLNNEPEILNQDPYGRGWIIGIDLKESEESEAMLTCQAYTDLIFSN